MLVQVITSISLKKALLELINISSWALTYFWHRMLLRPQTAIPLQEKGNTVMWFTRNRSK